MNPLPATFQNDWSAGLRASPSSSSSFLSSSREEGGGDARENVGRPVSGAEHQPGQGRLVRQFGEEDDAEDHADNGEADHGGSLR
jgi:hypothetical protein